MDTVRWLAMRLGLPEDSTENEIDAFIKHAGARAVSAAARSPRPSSTTGRNARLGYGAPEQPGPVPFGGKVTPSIAARDDAGRAVKYHPRGGFFHGIFAGRATASADSDERLPEDWFGPDGHARVRAG